MSTYKNSYFEAPMNKDLLRTTSTAVAPRTLLMLSQITISFASISYLELHFNFAQANISLPERRAMSVTCRQQWMYIPALFENPDSCTLDRFFEVYATNQYNQCNVSISFNQYVNYFVYQLFVIFIKGSVSPVIGVHSQAGSVSLTERVSFYCTLSYSSLLQKIPR